MSTSTVGISALGVHFPSAALPLTELGALRGVDPNKYLSGLGCHEMALCPAGTDVVTLAVGAARRALDSWSGTLADIGMIVVGTETAKDMSRPLSAWVAEELGLVGPVRSYEVKHACYGGTLALRQAVEWQLSGAARGKSALVIAADVALYAPEDGGEPTQGAGAVAMIVGTPDIAAVEVASFPYSQPAFDFWRPVGQAFPSVEGQLSLDCYKLAAASCFADYVAHEQGQAGGKSAPSALDVLNQLDSLCFHVPFPKMVKKAVAEVGERLGLDEGTTAGLYENKVVPTMRLNQRVGNCYTASLWVSVATALAGLKQGTRIGAFSYGSGFGGELLTLSAGPAAAKGAWLPAAERDLDEREMLDAAAYTALRAGHAKA
ncbi:MAG: hydroxymethylglutaryl-CoA synthase [Polyangiales bacterium]